MSICYPPAFCGKCAWRSTEDSLYPQEIGLDCRKQPSPDILSKSKQGGELIVEFEALYYPSSIDVYVGAVLPSDDNDRQSYLAESNPLGLYTSSVFTHFTTVHLVAPPSRSIDSVASRGASQCSNRLQTKIQLPNDAPFAFIRLLVNPSVSEKNPHRICEITDLTFHPPAPSVACTMNFLPGQVEADSTATRGIEEYLQRRRHMRPLYSKFLKSAAAAPRRNVSFSELEKWKKKLMTIAAKSSSLDPAAQGRRKVFLQQLVLEMTALHRRILQLQGHLQTRLHDTTANELAAPPPPPADMVPDTLLLDRMKAMVASFNEQCDLLVKRQNELMALPSNEHFLEYFHSSSYSSAAAAVASKFSYLQAAWTPRVLTAEDLVHGVYVKQFAPSRDVFCRQPGAPSLSLSLPYSESESESLREDGACNDWESHRTSSCRQSFRGVQPVSFAEHCFCEMWLKQLDLGVQERPECPKEAWRGAGPQRLKKAVLLSQLRLLDSMSIPLAPSPQGLSVANSLVLVSVVACQVMLRGSRDLWLSAARLVARMHSPSGYSKRDLCRVQYPVVVYALSLTLPSLVLGRSAVLEKYLREKNGRGGNDSADDEEFKSFQSSSLKVIEEVVQALSLCRHVGPQLLAAFFSRVVKLCVAVLAQPPPPTPTNLHTDPLRVVLVTITCAFFHQLRSLVIRFEFRSNTSLDAALLLELAEKSLSLPLPAPTTSAAPSPSTPAHSSLSPLSAASALAPAAVLVDREEVVVSAANVPSCEVYHACVHSAANGLLILCKSHIRSEKMTRAQEAAELAAKKSAYRRELEAACLPLQRLLGAVAEEEIRAQRRQCRLQAKRDMARQQRLERRQRAQCLREQLLQQQRQAREQLMSIIDVNRAAFLDLRDQRLEELRRLHPNNRDGDCEKSNSTPVAGGDNWSSADEKDDEEEGADFSDEDDVSDAGLDTHRGDDSFDLISTADSAAPAFTFSLPGFDEGVHNNENEDESEREDRGGGDEELGSTSALEATAARAGGGHAEPNLDTAETEVASRLVCHCILLQGNPAGRHFSEDAVTFRLDHYLFLRPLQQLFASHSDFMLMFGANNMEVDSEEQVQKQPAAAAASRASSPPPVEIRSRGDNHDDDDSDIDIDTLLEMSISEFNRQETFKSNPVEELRRRRRRSTDGTGPSLQHDSGQGAEFGASVSMPLDFAEGGLVGEWASAGVGKEGERKEASESTAKDQDEKKDIDERKGDMKEVKEKEGEDELEKDTGSEEINGRSGEENTTRDDEAPNPAGNRRKRRLKSSHTDVVLFRRDQDCSHDDSHSATLAAAKESTPEKSEAVGDISASGTKGKPVPLQEGNKCNFSFISYGPSVDEDEARDKDGSEEEEEDPLR